MSSSSCNTNEKIFNANNSNFNEEPNDIESAKRLIDELRLKCRTQTEQLWSWKKSYNIQKQQHLRDEKLKIDQLNLLTSQLLLLESKLKRKQKQIANILCQRELTICRQQKIIDALSSRLVDHGLESIDPGGYTDFDSLNDSDSAVVLEDIDSDYYNSIALRRKSCSSFGGGGGGGGGGGCSSSGYGNYSGSSINNNNNNSGPIDVTVVRSISDAIETNLKYSITRRSTCFLRRPDILETVYSVEEDPESDVNEKRDKFKNRSEKIMCSTDEYMDKENINQLDNNNGSIITDKNCNATNTYSYNLIKNEEKNHSNNNNNNNNKNNKQTHVTNYNRVMSNHRSVTKPKDVKYKRINKAKSKSLEELRGRLKHWVEKGNIEHLNNNNNNNNNSNNNEHYNNHLQHQQHNPSSSHHQISIQQAPPHQHHHNNHNQHHHHHHPLHHQQLNHPHHFNVQQQQAQTYA